MEQTNPSQVEKNSLSIVKIIHTVNKKNQIDLNI